ncbi:MAG: hypothetical protein QF491_18980 [Alphaproteobacteria bacterium]|nr:hypothetical protein [Alphaproteobacteria bacterium]
MIRALFALALVFLLAPLRPATAAPQILALLTTTVPQPLHCQGGTCTAVLSSFCLQSNRGQPFAGQPYAPIDAGNLVLVGETLDGQPRHLPLTNLLRFSANEPIASIVVALDREILAAHGLRRVAIQVKARTTLLPLVANDGDPQSPAEIARASGPMGELAETFFEGVPLWGEARLMTALMSRLPVHHLAAPAALRRLWQDAIDPALERAVPAAAIASARSTLGVCRAAVESGTDFNTRSCLESRHGILMRKRNKELWKAERAIW